MASSASSSSNARTLSPANTFASSRARLAVALVRVASLYVVLCVLYCALRDSHCVLLCALRFGAIALFSIRFALFCARQHAMKSSLRNARKFVENVVGLLETY